MDSEVPALDVLHGMICDLGVNMSCDQVRVQFLGVRMSECVRWIGNQLTHKPVDFEALFTADFRVKTELRFRQGLNAMPGASELLKKLNIPFSVATNGPREKVELTLSITGLRRYFEDRVFCAYETGFFKPDPGLFLHAAMAMGIKPKNCAVVEDSLPGVRAGLAAGMTVFSLYPASYMPSELFAQVTCIRKLSELEGHLGLTPGAGLDPLSNSCVST